MFFIWVFNSILFTNNKQSFKLHIFPRPIRNRCKWNILAAKKTKKLSYIAGYIWWPDILRSVKEKLFIYSSSWFLKRLNFYWDPICWLRIIPYFHLIACVFCSPLPLVVCRLCTDEASPFRAWNILDLRRVFLSSPWTDSLGDSSIADPHQGGKRLGTWPRISHIQCRT